jgi:transposase InsO family protein
MNGGNGLSVTDMCSVSGFSRAGYYRCRKTREPEPDEIELRDRIQRIALDWPAYGTRRIVAQLGRDGLRVNRKKIQRIVREDNLLCVTKRRFVSTTNSAHSLPLYRNLARDIEVTGLNQLWIADITYIRLRHEFVYLAVVLDACSRRVIGWCLDQTLESSLAVRALQMALSERKPTPGLIHHSDRGVQYASGEYTTLLTAHGVQISMSRKANPWDNAACESFMKTLKNEEVHRSEYLNLSDARYRIGEFLEAVYNERRLHSALRYATPNEYERQMEADSELAA